MIESKSVLAIIPARGGSKGFPGKNVEILAGKPLLSWTAKAAHESKYIDRIIVSSDDPEIIKVAHNSNCDVPFQRPSHLATDSSRTIEVIHHLLDNLDRYYDFIIQLQPTSPCRTAEDIDTALQLMIAKSAPSCVSVQPLLKSPHLTFSLSKIGLMSPILPMPVGQSRRQDFDKFYQLNGAIYAAESNWIRTRQSFLSDETIAYVMPNKRSIDIDDHEDFAIAKMRLHSMIKNN